MSKKHHLYAGLPFVELDQESSIQLGPVIFWPASRYKEFIEEKNFSNFKNYTESISQIKAKSAEAQFINTIKLSPEGITYLSIASDIAPEKRDSLLIDSLYLLYFACTFRDLYYGNEIPSFNAFRKMIPCSPLFIEKEVHWKNLFINENYREESICVHLFDKEICQALGKALYAIYKEDQNDPKVESYTRLIRGIRYLVDRFFHRFVNLFEKGLELPGALFEPEDVIFLASSFEALFDIDDRQMAADFKHKLRPLLHLKFAKPLELFWRWVDDFYEARRKIIHGGGLPDPLFKLNPNFEISHLFIGIKLFIYSVYYNLHLYGLIPSTHEDPYTPPDFKWIHPEEVLLFFWTEESVLYKVHHYLNQTEIKEEDLADLHWLTSLFVSMYERYFTRPFQKETLFIPTPVKQIAPLGNKIIQKIGLLENKKVKESITDHFIHCLQKRIAA